MTTEATITFGQRITVRNEWDEPVAVTLVHGDGHRGIGYGPDGPVMLGGGVTQRSHEPGSRWMWSRGDGLYFTVNRRPDGRLQWDRMDDPPGVGSGWSLEG